jgi:hypothetical protein
VAGKASKSLENPKLATKASKSLENPKLATKGSKSLENPKLATIGSKSLEIVRIIGVAFLGESITAGRRIVCFYYKQPEAHKS